LYFAIFDLLFCFHFIERNNLTGELMLPTDKFNDLSGAW
jgi:hypothetical protein